MSMVTKFIIFIYDRAKRNLTISCHFFLRTVHDINLSDLLTVSIQDV